MEQNARKPGRQSPEPYPEPGNEDGTKCQKTRETIPGTLPETKRIEEIMMEQNARIPGIKNHGGTKLFLRRIEKPIQLHSCLGNKPRNPSRNQEVMMEQDAKRIGRQARNPSRNQEMMMEEDSKKVGRHAPEP